MHVKPSKPIKRTNADSPPEVRKPILEKLNPHPRNRHRGRYHFAQLVEALPALKEFLITNRFDANELTINFANPAAVLALNAALLKAFYGVEAWSIPPDYLCPAIPGRADYVHYIADLLAANNNGVIPRGPDICGLDVGVGANCIYPLIGQHEYDWRFVGSDTDTAALAAAQQIVDRNAGLATAIELRCQSSVHKIFEGVVTPADRFDFVICNPPFHASAKEAEAGALRKWKNLGKADGLPKHASLKPKLNFGGRATELWCEGGEVGFVCRMVVESAQYRAQVAWFSALVSQEKNLPTIYAALRDVNARQVETINMAQGQKKSRIVAWRF